MAPKIGVEMTITCDVVFHGSSLNLKKISQTTERVDDQQQLDHGAQPPALLDGAVWSS